MISRLFERILLLEKKDHLIKKLNLTDGQKQQLIDHFKKFPHLESKIDWNNKNLTWKEFEPLLSEVSKSQFKKNMSKKEMGGLQEGEDYITLYDQDDFFLAQVLTHRQAVYFGSKNFMGHEGKWCVSSNSSDDFEKYSRQGSRLVIAQSNYSKFMINDNIRSRTREYYDIDDHSFDSEVYRGHRFIQKAESILNKLNKDKYDQIWMKHFRGLDAFYL